MSEEDVCVAIAIGKGNSELNELVSNVLNQISETERIRLMDEAIARNKE